MSTQSDNTKPASSLKPLQTIPYSEKTEEWRKQNLEYFINNANFRVNATQGSSQSNLQTWYNAYNNIIDESVFNYVVNPLNVSKDSIYANFPAKIRPYNILRPTIDLLIGEYSKRPFKFDVLNLDGDGVINNALEVRYATFKKNLTERAAALIQQTQGLKPEQVPDPKLVIEDLNSNYKDVVAIKGYKSLKLIEYDHKLRERFKDGFKHWLIAGITASLKYVKRSDLEYTTLSPMWIDIDKSPHEKNFEDGSYATAKFRVTVADLVDMFYDEIKEKDLKNLEQDESSYRKNLYASFSTNNGQINDTTEARLNKVDLYYCTWKSRKKIGFLNYFDPFTGEPLTDVVDESYVVDRELGETIEWEWVNEVWEGWRVNDALYLGIKPITVQRNELNNFSSCKLPINGRRFSDMESQNISILSLGMPYQIMFIIMNYRIELTIAKSKGKILLYDKNTISDDEEEQDKVFYYAEALGYLGLDRAADDVDRTWTGYTVHDMSLFQHIEQLIKIAQFYKDSWDELLGINRQRKGATNSSDGLGVTEEAIFRSSVISDIIFSGYDEFIESELQGMLDLSKFAWIDGKMGYYRNDDGRAELLAIDGEDHVNANMGVYVDTSSRTAQKLELLKQQVNAIAQRKDIKASTIADIIYTDSYAEIRAKMKEAETVEMEIAKQTAESEQQHQKDLEEIKKSYMQFENQLKLVLQEADWDRKDNNELIKGEIAGRVAKDPSGMDIDMSVIEQESTKRLERMDKSSLERQKLALDKYKADMKNETELKKIAASLKNRVVGEK